jgi:hypothetical protein
MVLIPFRAFDDSDLQSNRRKPMTPNQTPAPVTRPATGRYLLTPTTWSPEEKQALYRLQDRDALLQQMAGAFSCSVSDLDMPEEVYIERVKQDPEMYETGPHLFKVGKDGFLDFVNQGDL